MKFDVTVGQDVVLEPTGNFKRLKGSKKHGTVEKIARVYFYVRSGKDLLPFYKESCVYYDKEEANGGYELFPDDVAYDREMERRFMVQEIRIQARSGMLDELGYEKIKRMYDAMMETG